MTESEQFDSMIEHLGIETAKRFALHILETVKTSNTDGSLPAREFLPATYQHVLNQREANVR